MDSFFASIIQVVVEHNFFRQAQIQFVLCNVDNIFLIHRSLEFLLQFIFLILESGYLGLFYIALCPECFTNIPVFFLSMDKAVPFFELPIFFYVNRTFFAQLFFHFSV